MEIFFQFFSSLIGCDENIHGVLLVIKIPLFETNKSA